MGAFHEPIRLVAGPDEPSADLGAPVDTGAACTAGGSRVEREIGEAPIRHGDRQRTTLAVFGGDNAEALPGAVTLEEFGPGVDPVARRPAPVHGRLAGLHPGGGR